MVSAATARTVVGIIGNVISFGLFVAPVPTFWRIFKKKSVEEFKPDPYLATVLNCVFWVLYGLPFVTPDSTLVITINSFGLAIELFYLFIYFLYAGNKGRKVVVVVLLAEIIFCGAIGGGVIGGVRKHKTRSLAFGIICDVFNIIMYTAPLTVMKKVIQTKSVEYMPFYLSLANFLNGAVWMTYALIKIDVFILVSNGLGTLSGLVQLILYSCYYKTTPKDGKKPSEVQLSNESMA